MPLLYPFKRVTRNWKLFFALLIGVILASTFFAAINIKANLAAQESLDTQLKQVTSDLEFSTTINSTNLAWAMNNISSIEGVKSVTVVSRLYQTSKLPNDNFTSSYFIPIVVFPDSELINNEWLNRPEGEIGENQTYLVMGNIFKDRINIGDNISTSISFPMPKYYNSTYIPVNLTVAGYADLTDKGYAYVSGNRFLATSLGPSDSIERYNIQQDIMIVGWNSTFVKLWSNITNSAISATFLINVDHDKLLNPWDTATSAKNVQTVADDIQNNVLAYFETYGNINNLLGNILTTFEYNFSTTLLNFILVSIPVFFVAWYLGSTVSDVSYNLRRREIGLLSTKGMSSGQIQRMFLIEAITIGLIGGAIGVVCALALNQVFIGELTLSNMFNLSLLNPTTMLVTVIFGILLALFSAFRSARNASRLPTVQALREYVDLDSGTSYRKMLPAWIAFIFGTYKMSMFALGINVPNLLVQQGFSSAGGFNWILLQIIVYFDLFLTYFGPLFFFWGTTKLFVGNSLKFQQLTTSIYKLTGDLGALAAKNVRRNPKRLAAIAFLIAFIVGYSVQVTGQIASEQDLVSRTVHNQVGADISLSITNASQAPVIVANILENVSGIKNSTLEYQLSQNSQNYGQSYVKTIDPDSWQASAYFEPEWFTGASMEQAMNALKADNMTIILEKREAQRLNVNVGDQVGINFPSGSRKLTVVGFYGPEPVKTGSSSQTYAVQTWSYVPRNLFNMTIGSDAYPLEHFDTTMLIKLQDGINGTQVAEQIRSLDLEIYGVDSFDEQWLNSQQNNNSYTYSSLQTLDVQRLGLIFAVLSASVGTALVSLVSLKERSREATLMSVRGLSYRQLVWMFLTEHIAVITFSVILGLVAGTVILYGTVSTSGSTVSALITRHMVFPAEAIKQIGFYIALIYGSVILSVLIMARRYVTKLDKMVRLR